MQFFVTELKYFSSSFFLTTLTAIPSKADAIAVTNFCILSSIATAYPYPKSALWIHSANNRWALPSPRPLAECRASVIIPFLFIFLVLAVISCSYHLSASTTLWIRLPILPAVLFSLFSGLRSWFYIKDGQKKNCQMYISNPRRLACGSSPVRYIWTESQIMSVSAWMLDFLCCNESLRRMLITLSLQATVREVVLALLLKG